MLVWGLLAHNEVDPPPAAPLNVSDDFASIILFGRQAVSEAIKMSDKADKLPLFRQG